MGLHFTGMPGRQWSLCLGVRGPLSRASSPQLPSILCGNCSLSPLLRPVPKVGTCACGQGSQGSMVGGLGSRLSPSAALSPGRVGPIPHLAVPWGRMAALTWSHALAPAPASGEWGGWGLSGRVLERAASTHLPLPHRCREPGRGAHPCVGSQV